MSPNTGIADKPARILIVDDERSNRQLLEAMLAPDGFRLQTASSGGEALAIVARQPPDLILLDVVMPGLDGYQVAAKIKGDPATKNIPIIMITAGDGHQVMIRGLSAGAEDFLTKPVDRQELGLRVRNLLRLKAYADYHDTYGQMLEGTVAIRTADLVQSEQLYRSTFDAAPVGIIHLGVDGEWLRVNQRLCDLLGYSREELHGPDGQALVQADVVAGESEAFRLMTAGRLDRHVVEEKRYRRRDGRFLWARVNISIHRDAEGQPDYFISVIEDITQRKQAEAERLLLTERLSLATAVAKVGVWEWDLASNLLTWDATMFDTYGLPALVPMPYARWSAAVCPDNLVAVEAGRRKVIADKGQGSVEYCIALPDGSKRNVAAVERVVLDERGDVIRVIGVEMDVTKRKKAEEALEQIRQDQLRFKDEFLSHVSHELRSPLTAIKQFTSILLSGTTGDLSAKQREYQEIVLRNIRQLQAMIDDLLEVTRLEAGQLMVQLESVSVADAVTDSLNTLSGTASAKGVDLSFDVAPDLPNAHADQTRLRQILIILLDNAVKFTPGGGAVAIRARVLPQDPRFLLFEVSDSGCGVDPEAAERIFERLYQVSERAQASRKGLGLGLYICKELVTRLRGTIWVTSRPQKGSTFLFTLPVFTLSHLLAPLLKNGKWPAESAALITVGLRARDAWSTQETQEGWCDQVRHLIEGCLLPDLDVLLPTMSAGPEGRCLFVAAFADHKGASVLANGIREQYERLANPRRDGAGLSVSYTMLPPLPSDISAAAESFVATMARSLHEATKSHTISEAAYHE